MRTESKLTRESKTMRHTLNSTSKHVSKYKFPKPILPEQGKHITDIGEIRVEQMSKFLLFKYKQHTRKLHWNGTDTHKWKLIDNFRCQLMS